MATKPALSASELGTLWMTYQQKTMVARMLDYFIEKSDDDKAKEIMGNLQNDIQLFIDKLITLFEEEKVKSKVKGELDAKSLSLLCDMPSFFCNKREWGNEVFLYTAWF